MIDKLNTIINNPITYPVLKGCGELTKREILAAIEIYKIDIEYSDLLIMLTAVIYKTMERYK